MPEVAKMVKYYTEKNRQSWDEYVKYSKETTLFHLIGWKDAVVRSFNHHPYYIMAKDGERLKVYSLSFILRAFSLEIFWFPFLVGFTVVYVLMPRGQRSFFLRKAKSWPDNLELII